jgi:hypothetical protein
VVLLIYAVRTYEEHQAYKTGIYIGKAAFNADDFQNRRCLDLRGDRSQRVCKVNDLNQDSVMEDALTSANIIPSLADSTALHTGFRDGWREARTAAFANR